MNINDLDDLKRFTGHFSSRYWGKKSIMLHLNSLLELTYGKVDVMLGRWKS